MVQIPRYWTENLTLASQIKLYWTISKTERGFHFEVGLAFMGTGG